MESNLIEICAECKSIVIQKNPKPVWASREEFPELYDKIIENKEISHGMCYPCSVKLYGKEMADYMHSEDNSPSS